MRLARERGEAPPVGEGAAPPPPATDALGSRVTVPLTDGGRIDWDRVPSSQRDALDGAIRRELPIAPAGDALPVTFDDAIVAMLYDALSSVGVTIARAAGYSIDTAALMQFTTDEKAALVPATNKVLSKYSYSLGRYQDEIMLAVAVGSVVAAKVGAMRQRQPDVGRPARVNGTPPVSMVS